MEGYAGCFNRNCTADATETIRYILNHEFDFKVTVKCCIKHVDAVFADLKKLHETTEWIMSNDAIHKTMQDWVDDERKNLKVIFIGSLPDDIF